MINREYIATLKRIDKFFTDFSQSYASSFIQLNPKRFGVEKRKMKKLFRLGASIFMVSSLILGGTIVAQAEETTTTTQGTSNVNPAKEARQAEKLAKKTAKDAAKQAKMAAKAAKDKAKSDYKNAKNSYVASKKAINEKFKAAVKSARAAFKAAKNASLSPEQLNQLISTRDSAIASATAARDAELAALGAAPVKPVN